MSKLPKLTQEYILGVRYNNGAARTYKYTIKDGEHKGKVLYSKTWTPHKNHEWGKPETVWRTEPGGTDYRTFEDAFKNLPLSPSTSP